MYLPDATELSLGVVREACTDILVGGYHRVLYGKLIAAKSDHTVVVVDDDFRVKCYNCLLTTQGRMVYCNREGYVTRIDACCEHCESRLVQAAAGLGTAIRRAQEAAVERDGWPNLGKLRYEVRQYAERRTDDFVRVIGRARKSALWPPVPPLVPGWVLRQYFAQEGETNGASPRPAEDGRSDNRPRLRPGLSQASRRALSAITDIDAVLAEN